MNFSKALRGQLGALGAIKVIQSQSETELRRKLNKDELAILIGHTHPSILVNQIEKVCIINVYTFNLNLKF